MTRAIEILNKMLIDGKTLCTLTSEELIQMMNCGSLTSQLYYTIEQEYIRRLTQKKENVKNGL